MMIRKLSSFIEDRNLTDYVLKDSAVVIDAQNYFYRLYEFSGCQYIFGCESDKYADYLRDHLSMFKKANIKCYFIFKGGNQEYIQQLGKLANNNINVQEFNINEEYQSIVHPIFMKDVHKQVLDEMGFIYTICEYDAKRECIALAQRLKCPVVSHNVEYCFSGQPYIMQNSLKYDEQTKSIQYGIFSLDAFLQKYYLTEEKLAVFITLTNEKDFPNNHFLDFIKSLNINCYGYYWRNQELLAWLARATRENALNRIFRYTNKGDKEKFFELERKNRELIRRQEKNSQILAQYLDNGCKNEITEKDQFWFQKGVASKHIAIQLINLVRFGIFEGSWAIADYSQDDARIITLDIIKYTYNLLTNFEKEHLTLFVNKQFHQVSVTDSISKPSYEGISSPFENGWKHLKGELFKYFLNELFEGFDFEIIQKLPDDLRMVMIALIYFSNKKAVATKNEACSVLLSYVALKDVDKTNVDNDQLRAKCVLKKYLDISKDEAKMIFDVKLLHPLVEFQHGLQSLNHLNILCGKLYKPTIYSTTFNGTFVYKAMYTIVTQYHGDYMKFLDEELDSAPAVLSNLKNLIKIYEEIMDNM